MPIHLHPYYKNNLGTEKGLCPVAENVYKRIITLPIFPTMTEADIQDVIGIVKKVVNYFTSFVNTKEKIKIFYDDFKN